MKEPEIIPGFKAVEWVRSVRDEHYELTKNMTDEEETRFLRERADRINGEPTGDRFTVYIRTTPERLWEALTSPELTRRYFDFMEGFMSVESEWAPGSPVVWRTADGAAQIEGRVLEVVPPIRLVTTFCLLYYPEERRDPPSRLSWEIERLGEVCKLLVGHEGAGSGTETDRDVAVCMPSILNNLRVLLETGKPRLIKAIVVDCERPAALARFWAAAAGYVMQGEEPAAEDFFVGLADPLGVGPELGFQRASEGKTGKNRLHLDLHVADAAAEVERLLALGARRAPGYPQGEGHWVLLDPEGNEFCVDE